ncbi:MAG: hypothetical protein QGF67_17350 [Lentisphaeria bacterium]|jgi:hypothetical protein|nr:hypothetical protein [Lentisphaeria bacterium]MDP7743208.1 hypothetical protein [Lentisphaeria bacterium]
MWFLSLVIWLILIYSLRISIVGSPEYTLVRDVPPAVLDEAAACLDERVEPDDDDCRTFLQRFMHLSILKLVLFLLELVVAWVLLAQDIGRRLAWFIVVKNLGMLCISNLRSRIAGQNVFDAVMDRPRWLASCERGYYLVSAGCLLYLFLQLNDLV